MHGPFEANHLREFVSHEQCASGLVHAFMLASFSNKYNMMDFESRLEINFKSFCRIQFISKVSHLVRLCSRISHSNLSSRRCCCSCPSDHSKGIKPFTGIRCCGQLTNLHTSIILLTNDDFDFTILKNEN